MMRLICPKCEAQYDVADEAIPPGGRDVQCSNCQQTWFQTDKPVVAGRETSRVLSRSLPKVEATKAGGDTPKQHDAAAPAEPPRKALDEAVASILREEASLGGAAPKPIPGSGTAKPQMTQETKPSLNVDADATRKRIAQMTEAEGGTLAAKASAVAAAASGADTGPKSIPNIAEINAVLRARAEAHDTSGLTETEKSEAVQRSGFRRGFFLVLILFVILIAPYIFADLITENLPQTRGFMGDYVNGVDQLRISLNALVGGLFAD